MFELHLSSSSIFYHLVNFEIEDEDYDNHDLNQPSSDDDVESHAGNVHESNEPVPDLVPGSDDEDDPVPELVSDPGDEEEIDSQRHKWTEISLLLFLLSKRRNLDI